MEIIEQQFILPDGKGGFNVYHFETSDKQVVMSDGERLDEKYIALFNKVKQLNGEKIIPSRNEIQEILNATYVPTGSNGEGELNGVPTSAEMQAILNGTYTHTDKNLDEFAPEDVISANEVSEILNGTY